VDQPAYAASGMTMPTKGLTVQFDVDNMLLNNDRVQEDVSNHIGDEYGRHTRNRYFKICEELRAELVTLTISARWSATGSKICMIRSCSKCRTS
jgi:hypothetical protein